MSSENKVQLESEHFFDRVLEALGLLKAYGVKAQLANKLGITPTAIGFWEEGNVPGIDALKNVVKVSELSGTSLHWLLTGKGEKYYDASSIPSYNRYLSERLNIELDAIRKHAEEQGVSFDEQFHMTIVNGLAYYTQAKRGRLMEQTLVEIVRQVVSEELARGDEVLEMEKADIMIARNLGKVSGDAEETKAIGKRKAS